LSFLCVLFNKIGEKGRTARGMDGRGKGGGPWRRNDPNNVCIYEYINKEIKSQLIRQGLEVDRTGRSSY
jgi:hypothetical protein